MNHRPNLAQRAGRCSAEHRRVAIFGWLAVVIASFQSRGGDLTVADPAFRAAVLDVATRLRGFSTMTNVESPLRPANAQLVSRDGRSALVTFDIRGDENTAEDRVSAIEDDFRKAEYLSLPITLAILVLAFGALVAAGLPLLLGLSGAGEGGGARPRRRHVGPRGARIRLHGDGRDGRDVHHRQRKQGSESGFWSSIVGAVLRHPVVSVLLAGGLLVVLALPTLRLHTVNSGVQGLPRDLAVMQTYDRIQAAFPGEPTAATVALSTPRLNSPRTAAAIARLRREALATGLMRDPVTVTVSPDRQVAKIDVPLVGTGTDDASDRALLALRDSWLPLFLFVILFGLSMDYHVFILSRVREGYDRGMPTEEAVSHGIRATAGVVTSAAAVMVGVFAIFATLSSIDFKMMGVGLSVAVLLDATVVRAVLLPATMKLLGEWNWYLPRWLEWLPRVAVEEPAPDDGGATRDGAAGELAIDVARADGSASLSLAGELDLQTTPQFRDRLSDVEPEADTLVVDLRRVTFIDSSGIGELVGAHQRARRVVLVRTDGTTIDRVLQLAAVDKLFETASDPPPELAGAGTT